MPDREESHGVETMRTLRLSRLFGGLKEDGLLQVAGFCRTRSLEKGQVLFREGDRSQGFYLVQSGAVCLHRLDAKGREIVLQVFREGESFAEATLCTLENYPAGAKALEATRVLLVERQGFVDLVRRHPEIALRGVRLPPCATVSAGPCAFP